MYGRIYNYTSDGVRLTTGQLAVYAAVCMNMDYKTNLTSISLERLSQITGLTREGVRYTLKRLLSIGLLEHPTQSSCQNTWQNSTTLYAVPLKGLRAGHLTEDLTENLTENLTHKNNINNNIKNNINNTHTLYNQNISAHAHASPGGYKITQDNYKEMGLTPNTIRKYTYCSYWQAVSGFKAFMRQALAKEKTYTDAADARAHCLDWIKAKYLRYQDIPKAAAHEAEILAKEEQSRHK